MNRRIFMKSLGHTASLAVLAMLVWVVLLSQRKQVDYQLIQQQ